MLEDISRYHPDFIPLEHAQDAVLPNNFTESSGHTTRAKPQLAMNVAVTVIVKE